ncbi:MAG: ABC transporter substrate-binding protein [Anaerolineales bacterium]|jgi:peptide/nickel transport system substrate-binding protein|nr:ABC transporter substrate-binding protein [Anaerolineales bacterium]
METKKIHPLIPEAQEELRKGNISRRDFLRISTLLGMSLASAKLLAACAQPPASPVATEAGPAATVAVTEAPKAGPVRGGVLRAATRVERVDHPARFSLVSQSHAWRHVFEYLTYTDPKGITQPYLLEKWEASDDLLTWTLYVRKGVKFNNGQELTADDVVFNFGQWLNKDVGSSLLGAMSYLDASGVEKKDDYTVVLHLNAPSIFIPEHLFQYPAAIVPKTFGGDITREPIGTGAFTMAEYVPAERCRLVARKDYWRNGEDGKPLPYLDELLMVQLGEDRSADLAALQTGQVDTIIEPPVSVWEAVKDDARFEVVSTPTSATRVLRMRVDQDPWQDNRVRQALKYCHNREKILAVALQNQGTIGNDSHVAQAHPEYVDIPPFPFDTEKSKALLAEAGYPNGVTVELVVASDWPESMAYAQALKEDAAAGGFTINLKTMPASQYWDGWTEWNLGITWWAHRTLAPMLLPLAYIADADGKPVPWNETRWVDEEFSKILKEAEATLDLPKRRELVGKLEEIQKERGSVCIPFFMNVWKIYDKKFHGIVPSPEEYAIFYETWKEA